MQPECEAREPAWFGSETQRCLPIIGCSLADIPYCTETGRRCEASPYRHPCPPQHREAHGWRWIVPLVHPLSPERIAWCAKPYGGAADNPWACRLPADPVWPPPTTPRTRRRPRYLP